MSKGFLIPENITQLDSLTVDFLTEKDLIDVLIMRMGSYEFVELRVELAVYLYTHAVPKLSQEEMDRPYMSDAHMDAKFYHIETVRGLCLCLNIAVQSGTHKAGANGKADVAKAFADRGGHALPYHKRMVAIAEAISVTCNPRWKADVLSRSMLIVTGASTNFRGSPVNLDKKCGLSDDPLIVYP